MAEMQTDFRTRAIEAFYRRLYQHSPATADNVNFVKEAFMEGLRDAAEDEGDPWTAEIERKWSEVFDAVAGRMTAARSGGKEHG